MARTLRSALPPVPHPRTLAPVVPLAGFVLLLAALFTVAHAVGAAAGPVAPGMHRAPGHGSAPRSGGGHGGSGMHGMAGM